jgi:hypothetical protein
MEAQDLETRVEASVKHGRPYRILALMALASYGAMYALMYAMVDRFANVFANVNQAYMAGLMAAPMVIIELLLMRHMYPDARRNRLIHAGSIAIGVACWLGIRQQVLVGDRQFLRSMIPHHAGAILMCREAAVRDAEVIELCRGIIASQQAEIDQMKAILRRAP